MQTLTKNDLVNMLKNVNRPIIITFETETTPDMVKKDRTTKEPNPFLNITKKFSKINGIINFRYADAVTKQRVKEAEAETLEDLALIENYIPAPRQWGEHIQNTPLIEHTNKNGEYSLYIEVMVNRAIMTTYTINDQPATQEQLRALQAFLPVKNEGARQELENPIIVRDYKIDSIKSFTLNGEKYLIV